MVFSRREATTLLIGDFLILTASLWVALAIRNLALPSLSYLERNIGPFIPVFLVSLLVFYISGLYEKQTRLRRRIMSIRILGAQVGNVAIAAILFFVLPLSIAPKTILVLYLIVSVVLESVWRFYRMSRVTKAEDQVGAVLVGSGELVTELYDEVRGNAQYLLRFSEHIDTSALTSSSVSATLRVALESGVRTVVVDTANETIMREGTLLFDLMREGVTFLEFAPLYEEIFDRVPLGHSDTRELMESASELQRFYDVTKRFFDVVLALVLGVIALPFIMLAAILLYIENGAPFLEHERVGRGGRTFRIRKLRSMLFDDHGNPELQKKNRVTHLGTALRKTRIDELPQLWNVLVGDLSFIGPRPELPAIAAVYEREVPQYRLRYAIAPGLSGWAQIHDYDAPRGPADVARTRTKVSYDLYYLKHRSLGLDLAIATKTIRTLLAFSGT